MDYSTYFATTPQALHYFGLSPGAAFAEETKLDAVDHVDAAFFPPYDFRFSQPQNPQNSSLGPTTQGSPSIPAHTGASEGSPRLLPASGLTTLPSVDSGIGLDSQGLSQGNDDLGRTRSSSEEKESLTPAQSRRKAQNRAAQRAFRERKERHVKDLEAKLSALESSATSLATDNERLKLALQRATTENEILRATSSNSHRLSIGSNLDEPDGGPVSMGGVDDPGTSSAAASAQGILARSDSNARRGPMGDGLLPGDSYAMEILANTNTNGPDAAASAAAAVAGASGSGMPEGLLSNPLYAALSSAAPSSARFTPHSSRAASSFLPAAATWDLIQAHPLVKRGVVDIADVCDALRGTARCDGQGPVFREEMVWRAVEQARRSGGDELI